MPRYRVTYPATTREVIARDEYDAKMRFHDEEEEAYQMHEDNLIVEYAGEVEE